MKIYGRKPGTVIETKSMNTEQRDTSHLNQPEPIEADTKHIPTSFSEWLEQNGDSIDIGGNWTPDRIQSNKDRYQ
jgi:hypothetical protein